MFGLPPRGPAPVEMGTWDRNRLKCFSLRGSLPASVHPKEKGGEGMKHLNLELEKLEQRIAPGGISLGLGAVVGVGVGVQAAAPPCSETCYETHCDND